MDNAQAVKAAIELCRAVFETVKEAGLEGAPEGPMYLAFQTRGFSLDTFQRVTDKLISLGLVRRENHILYAVKP